MSLDLGQQLLAAPKAAAAALQGRTGVDCTLGPRPSPGRGVQLFIRPQAPIIEGTRSAGRPGTTLYRVAYDTVLRLRGCGAVGGGDSFYAEAVQAHFKVNVALDSSFEVAFSQVAPDANVPDEPFATSVDEDDQRLLVKWVDEVGTAPTQMPSLVVDAEGQGTGDFFQESPQSGDYLYRKDWLLTLRFKRTITEEDRQQMSSTGGITLTVDID